MHLDAVGCRKEGTHGGVERVTYGSYPCHWCSSQHAVGMLECSFDLIIWRHHFPQIKYTYGS